jgi:hypothetical protein
MYSPCKKHAKKINWTCFLICLCFQILIRTMPVNVPKDSEKQKLYIGKKMPLLSTETDFKVGQRSLVWLTRAVLQRESRLQLDCFASFAVGLSSI